MKRFLGEHHCKMIKKTQQQENRSVEFLSQRREGAKIVNSLTLRLRAFA